MKLLVLFITLVSCSKNKVDMSWGMKAEEVARLRQVESTKFKRKSAAIDGLFSFYLESKSKVKVKAFKTYDLITGSMGSGTPLSCFVYKERKLVAKHIHEMTEKLSQASLKKEYIESKAGLFAGFPYLSLTTQVLNKDKSFSLIKVISGRYAERQITCLNTDNGYMKSFRRIVANFFTSINDKKHKTPKFEQVFFLTKGKKRFGYQYDRLSRRKSNGGDLYRFESHYLDILNPSEVKAVDEVILEAVDRKGKVNEILSERYENGKLLRQTTIKPDGGVETFSISSNLRGDERQSSYSIPNFRSRLTYERDILAAVLKTKQTYKDSYFWSTKDKRKPTLNTYSFQKTVKGKTYIKLHNENGGEIWRYNNKQMVELKVIQLGGQKIVSKRAYINGDL